MRISILCEDTVFKNKYEAEHGLSILITTKRHKILFDTGQSDLFLRNAERLGEDLRDVDVVVLSHGHYDHCNGLRYFLERNTNATIYLHEHALGDFFNGERYIGTDASVKALSDRFVLLNERVTVGDGIDILTASEIPVTSTSPLEQMVNGVRISDRFDHEIYLTVAQGKEKVLFTGCGHRGITSIAEMAAGNGVTHIVGGFHLTDDLSAEEVDCFAGRLRDFPIRYYSGHCTSKTAIKILQGVLEERFSTIASGFQFAVGSKGEIASALFRNGYNCSQSVFGAFAQDLGIPFDTAMKISCSFGGGMGRLREVCGAVSGMLLVCGMAKGYSTPETGDVKAEHYRLVQTLAKRFKELHGSLYCRDLLGGTVSDLPTPTERTPEFYQKRPCERLIASAADILEEILFLK